MMMIAHYSLKNNFDFVLYFFGAFHAIVMIVMILMMMIMMHLNMLYMQ